MAPKHALPTAAKPPKRRRRQASVRAFFAPQPPPPPKLPKLPKPPEPPSPPCVSSSSPSPPSSQQPAAAPDRIAAAAPPPPPPFAPVCLAAAVDVPPAPAQPQPVLRVAVAVVAVDVPPARPSAPAPAPAPAPTPASRTPTRSSMRLRSASQRAAAAADQSPHEQPHTIVIDSDCDTKPSSATPSPLAVESDDDSERPISRLSRRNRSKLSKRPNSAPAFTASSLHPFFNRQKPAPPAPSRNSPADAAAPNARPSPPLPPPPKKKLHPFFTATAAALSSAKERSKPAKPPLPLLDAWHCPSATIHVNHAPPSQPWRLKPQLALPPPHDFVADANAFTQPPAAAATNLSPAGQPSSQPCAPFQVVQHASKNTDLWAEFYKKDSRIDVINGSAIKQLVDWLRKWYEPPEESVSDSDAESTDSYFVAESDDKERVAVITGDTGCGKSTVIATAARHVGLSVLEINASTCRTGKKIREIIGDALSTHRVTHGRFKLSSTKRSKPKERTLIVFEDVDQLQDDEKGFWTTFQKLAASGDCRRPIVCTATTFSSKMRHIFAEVKPPMEADMQRLFISTRVDQALNPPPLPYKHICFLKRTDRQSLAVLARVSGSEAVKTVVDMEECLALLCRNDTRRALNLLQFWGSSGLVIPRFEKEEICEGKGSARRLIETQDRISLGVLQAVAHEFVTSFLFQWGSRNFSIKILQSPGPLKPGSTDTSCSETAALDSWSETLDTLSSADMLRGHALTEKQDRSMASNGNGDILCMHSDLEGLLVQAEELDIAATRFSAKYLLCAHGAQQLRDISQDAIGGVLSVTHQTPLNIPCARRPIVTEYIPILRTMAVQYEREHARDKGSREGDRFARRTRSRSRREGFSALDLDPETISTLRKTSIRIRKESLKP
ncbi:P-loop containing nucleoside triphosphate hydrolase [Gracilaria domingensis]|nr:P-loop containing nucleoside triphosphate hydrolase [Gracilaria domingensis]